MFEETFIKDLFVFRPKVYSDERGFFMESYTQKLFLENGINVNFIQDNHSKSVKNVLRGLHFQAPPFAQTKLVRCVSGSLLDVAVDLRKNSKTYKQSFTTELSSENKKQLLIPQGFAHGFVVLSDSAEMIYKVDNYYNKESDAGIIYSDPDLNIDWKVDLKNIILSEKDKNLSFLKDLKNPF